MVTVRTEKELGAVLKGKGKQVYLFLFAIITCLCIYGCSSLSISKLTPQDAMTQFKELTPKEGAEYYMDNRDDYSFLDTLYRDSIMPAVLSCNYFDMDSVALKGTTFEKGIQPVRDQKRNTLINQIEEELSSNSNKQCQAFQECYLPSLEMSIDSMLQEDVSDIMDDYAGGFLNYKKLSFFFGRNRNDFKKMFWEKFDTLKYQDQIKSYINNFFNNLNNEQNAYCVQMTGKSFKFNASISTPSFPVGLSKSTLRYVKKYTSKQKDEMVKEAVKDYVVPMAVSAVSGGLGTLYDIGNTAYDVNDVIKQIKNAKIDDDEMVKYICEHDVAYQIKNYYLDKWVHQVFQQVKESNQELFRQIVNNL